MDFTTPAEQVICFNGDMLTIYLPDAAAVLQQSVKEEGNAATLATAAGLALMSRYYSVAYEIGQAPVPLEEGSSEKVVKLVLNRRNTSEAFRFIKLAINAETKLIRRVEAVTTRGESFVFNFTDYKLNQDLTEQRFIYDPPSSANSWMKKRPLVKLQFQFHSLKALKTKMFLHSQEKPICRDLCAIMLNS